MNWLDKLERKFRSRGIYNITSILVGCTLFGYVLLFAAVNGSSAAAAFINFVQYSPALILRGQVWRLVTWIISPQGSLSFLNLLFMFCLFMLGRSMEQGLGVFRMTVYYIGGWLISTVGGLIIYFISGGIININLNMYYILFSLYLMLGIFMPEAEMRLYFVLPIKMKWLVIVYFIMMAYEVFSYFRHGVIVGVSLSAEIVFAVINLLIFVSACKNRLSLRGRRKQVKRQRVYQQQFNQVRPGSPDVSQHKCCICGRTEFDDPNLTFRYCSKCAGSREYCNDHLFTHEHYRG